MIHQTKLQYYSNLYSKEVVFAQEECILEKGISLNTYIANKVQYFQWKKLIVIQYKQNDREIIWIVILKCI